MRTGLPDGPLSPYGAVRRASAPARILTGGVDTETKPPTAAAYRNLVTATIGFTLTFWAWDLIAPIAGWYGDRLDLSSFQQSLLVAVPVLVGSVGRIPAGALTDRYGAKLMFPVVSALTIVPVLLLIVAKDSYALMLVVGFLLGLGGTTFAIGIPLVNSWFPPAKRGLALGVFGMGMGGVALSGYFTPGSPSTARTSPSSWWRSRSPCTRCWPPSSSPTAPTGPCPPPPSRPASARRDGCG